MKESINRKVKSLYLLAVAGMVLSAAGCGGGGNQSSEVVSGVAAVGAPLSGQVTLKDSSDAPREKVAQIEANGAFSIDVTGMTPPYLLQARGSAGGAAYQLHSIAQTGGTANVNPLSDVIVANAAGVADPAAVFAHGDHDRIRDVAEHLSPATARVMTALRPLLSRYGAAGTDPITSSYSANHQNLDLMFDQVKITLSGGTMTIVDIQSGSVICSGSVTDLTSLTVNTANIPSAPSPAPAPVPAPAQAPAPPTGVTATGGTGQISLTWNAVAGAASYNVYYGTTSGVTTAAGTKVSVNSASYLHTGLAAGSTYHYLVTAVNSAGEGAASAPASATTGAPAVLDGLALYNQYCNGCHGTAKMGRTAAAIQGAITANIGAMGSLSSLSAAQISAIAATTAPVVTPPPACGSCHAIPPATGRHSFHTFAGCATCHGTGYSTTTVNSATHSNGVKNVATTIGWSAGTRTCSNACHATRAW